MHRSNNTLLNIRNQQLQQDLAKLWDENTSLRLQLSQSNHQLKVRQNRVIDQVITNLQSLKSDYEPSQYCFYPSLMILTENKVHSPILHNQSNDASLPCRLHWLVYKRLLERRSMKIRVKIRLNDHHLLDLRLTTKSHQWKQ